jgi:hypothetical protein
MPKKTLSGSEAEDWRQHVVEFRYKGKPYSVPVETLMLSEMSVEQIKDYLNEIPARLSYWKSFAVHVERELADEEEIFEIWLQGKYMQVDEADSKRTEGFKKTKAIMDNQAEYNTRKAAIRDLQDINKKVAVIVNGYNTLTWTLREIARLTHAELSNIELRGKGSLSSL